MCGIFFSATISTPANAQYARDATKDGNIPSILQQRLTCRGPDSANTISSKVTTSKHTVNLTFHSTVLSLRGAQVTRQPLSSSTSHLCWNGEAWAIGSRTLEAGESDTNVVFGLLEAAVTTEDQGSGKDATDPVIDALMAIQGPFAIVYHDVMARRVYFGRDSIGRRSLLHKSTVQSDNGAATFMLSSVGDGTPGWMEVPAHGVFVLGLDNLAVSAEGGMNITLANNCPSSTDTGDASITCVHYKDYGKYATFNHTPPEPDQRRLLVCSPAVEELEQVLLAALSVRVRTIPGLFDTNYHESHVPGSPVPITPLLISISPPPPAPPPRSTPVAILFSGGLDCTLLACLLHTLLPAGPIDLLNVAFQNPHSASSSTDTSASYAACPDRRTAIASFQELRTLCPTRSWTLVEINVPYAETLEHRQTVLELMAPHNTEMDFSIALALYFAARGRGLVHHYPPPNLLYPPPCTLPPRLYTTGARVLFSGLGADELFAGYSRHARAFATSGFAGLSAEMQLDVDRLGERNLGRDDRVIAHWGREVRFPFLDENVVKWAVEKGVGEICGFGLAPPKHEVGGDRDSGGERDDEEDDGRDIEDGKLVLRLLALKLGMRGVAREKKRAIQFGARTAKMQGKTKGTAVVG